MTRSDYFGPPRVRAWLKSPSWRDGRWTFAVRVEANTRPWRTRLSAKTQFMPSSVGAAIMAANRISTVTM
jgi:hypothetical protein